MKIVILGNGIAGVTVAQALRERAGGVSDLSIGIYSREKYHFYSRIRLPEVIASGMEPEKIRLYKDEWYASRDIAVKLGETAVAVDRRRKIVHFASGSETGYDKLVLALGADAARPPVPGFELPGVFTLRAYPDAAAIRTAVRPAAPRASAAGAAVLGGGFLGLEAARSIAESGASATVFEIFPRLLPRQLDAAGAGLLKTILERMGLDIILSAETSSIAAADGALRIDLKDGRSFPAIAVLLSMGIRPSIALARETGLEVGRGIRVDSRLRTSDPDIHAVGDCAEFEGVVWGNIPAAMEQARACAAALLGESGAAYSQTVPKNTLKIAGVDLFSIGETLVEGERADAGQAVARQWRQADRYEKYVLADGKLAGAIILGSKANVAWCQANIGKPASKAEIEARLKDAGA